MNYTYEFTLKGRLKVVQM